MSGFVLHPEEYTDLAEIWDYIAADSLDAADRTLEEICDAIKSLAAFPFIGHSRPDLTTRPLRFQALRDYVIVYAPDERPLAVIAVLHGRRSPRVIAAILRGRT
jgi:plasmid stabilization system protein ParE